jgi:hypothetical protein
MECQPEPVRIILPFRLVAVRHFPESEAVGIMVIPEEGIQGEFGAVFLVHFAEELQIELVEEAGGAFLCQVIEEENMVVNEEVVAFEAGLVPDYLHLADGLAVGIILLHSDGVELLFQQHFGGKSGAGEFGISSVHLDAGGGTAGAGDCNFQAIAIFNAMIVIQDCTVSGKDNIKHYADFSKLVDCKIFKRFPVGDCGGAAYFRF